jgi:hypothetical protein
VLEDGADPGLTLIGGERDHEAAAALVSLRQSEVEVALAWLSRLQWASGLSIDRAQRIEGQMRIEDDDIGVDVAHADAFVENGVGGAVAFVPDFPGQRQRRTGLDAAHIGRLDTQVSGQQVRARDA